MRESALCPHLWRSSLFCQLLQQQKQLRSIAVIQRWIVGQRWVAFTAQDGLQFGKYGLEPG
jgi:hypothetical protein